MRLRAACDWPVFTLVMLYAGMPVRTWPMLRCWRSCLQRPACLHRRSSVHRPPSLPRRRYGGVVYRENVAQLSDWYVFAIPAITAALREAMGLPAAAGAGSGA